MKRLSTATNVTKQVGFGCNDGQVLPLTKCVCGRTFFYWMATLGTEKEEPFICPSCGAKLFFKVSITVFKV